MAGYFSRIAKHSGLRVSGTSGGARAAGTNSGSHLPAPLGIEETVLVPSVDMDERLLGSPGQKPEVTTRTVEQQIRKVPARKKQSPEIRDGIPSQAMDRPGLKPLQDTARIDSPAPSGLETTTRAVRTEKASAKSASAGEGHIAGQMLVPDASRSESHERPDAANAVEAEPSDTSRTKQYFTKTAEVIERDDFGAAEIQDIVLHDVQEWAAASPTSMAMREVRAAEMSGNGGIQDTVHTRPERELTAITDERRRKRAEATEASGLEEETMNLSIGTISIVVEDREKPAQQTELKRQDQGHQNRRQVSPRQFSRLSRNYL